MWIARFWKDMRERPSGVFVETSPAEAAPAPSPESATSTLVSLLRDCGSHAFDVGDVPAARVEQLFHSWAQHLETLTPPPQPTAVAAGRRDWNGLRNFFLAHRRRERQYVTSGFDDLRLLIWSFVKLVAEDVHRGQHTDDQMSVQLNRLRSAIASSSLDNLKRESESTLNVIGQVIAERQRAQEQHLRAFGRRLQEMRRELYSTRKELSLDPLTRLFNRAAFDEQIQRTLEMSVFSSAPASLLMVDVDLFKKINDTLGHPAGDSVLKHLSDIFARCFPRKNDFVARYGGEEFAVLLPEDGREVAVALGEKFMQAVRQYPFLYEGKALTVTVSLGVAECRAGEAAVAWIRRADAALYEAKHAGRDRLVAAPV